MKKWSLLAVLVALVSMGYASGPKHATAQMQSAPEWVLKGSGAFNDDKGKAFYGVGAASSSSSMQVMRSTADKNAGNEAAKALQVRTASLMKDYQAATSAGKNDGAAEELHIEQAMQSVIAMAHSRIEIVDHWMNPETGELFALARIELNTVKDILMKSKDLNHKAKDYLRKNIGMEL